MSVIAYTKRKFSIYNKEGIYEKRRLSRTFRCTSSPLF